MQKLKPAISALLESHFIAIQHQDIKTARFPLSAKPAKEATHLLNKHLKSTKTNIGLCAPCELQRRCQKSLQPQLPWLNKHWGRMLIIGLKNGQVVGSIVGRIWLWSSLRGWKWAFGQRGGQVMHGGKIEMGQVDVRIWLVNLGRSKMSFGTRKTGQLREVVNLERWSTYRGFVWYKYISGQFGTGKSGQLRGVVNLRRWSTWEVVLYFEIHRSTP